MGHPRFPGDEISRIGEELYETKIRSLVETEGNIGRLISIDIETGEYELGDGLLEASSRIIQRHPDAAIYTARISYDAVLAVGGTISRTEPLTGKAA